MHVSTQTNQTSSYVNGHGMDSYIPVEIQFRHMHESKRVIRLIEQMMEKFDKYPLPGAKAHVVIDETHHKESTGVYQVKAKLFVPGERLYVAGSSEKTGMHDGVYSAISDVFDTIEKQLVKRHGRRAARRHKAYETAA